MCAVTGASAGISRANSALGCNREVDYQQSGEHPVLKSAPMRVAPTFHVTIARQNHSPLLHDTLRSTWPVVPSASESRRNAPSNRVLPLQFAANAGMLRDR